MEARFYELRFSFTKLSSRFKRSARGLQSEYQAYQLLSRMGYSDVVVLALIPLFDEISGKGGFPMADVFCGVEECISQVAGTALFHVRVCTCSL